MSKSRNVALLEKCRQHPRVLESSLLHRRGPLPLFRERSVNCTIESACRLKLGSARCGFQSAYEGSEERQNEIFRAVNATSKAMDLVLSKVRTGTIK
jgi:hypothetical protein